MMLALKRKGIESASDAKMPLWLRPVTSAANRLRAGVLTISVSDGRCLKFRGNANGPEAQVVIHSPRAVGRILMSGDVGFAEGYMAGDWDTPNLSSLLELIALNEADLSGDLERAALMRFVNRIRHAVRRNSHWGSRRNVRYHYDLGNTFYAAWLDKSMTYSCALFDDPRQPLEDAQQNKYERVLRLLEPAPRSEILEIGCGWGGFAETAAKAGHSVTGITLSPAQLEYASTRVGHTGVAERVELRLQDYRTLRERFDYIVSIEMMEAVGEAYWPLFFNTLRNCLRPGGRAVLQVITIADDVFSSYRRGVDFIQRYIFPGGMLPSPRVFSRHAADAKLAEKRREFTGPDYDLTLAHWYNRVLGARTRIQQLGFDERFLRMWRYYIAYCQAGFRTGRIDLMRTVLQRP